MTRDKAARGRDRLGFIKLSIKLDTLGSLLCYETGENSDKDWLDCIAGVWVTTRNKWNRDDSCKVFLPWVTHLPSLSLYRVKRQSLPLKHALHISRSPTFSLVFFPNVSLPPWIYSTILIAKILRKKILRKYFFSYCLYAHLSSLYTFVFKTIYLTHS